MRLAAAARRLQTRCPRPGARSLPTLLLFTDPDRTPQPDAVARTLPRGSGIVYRAFGSKDAKAVARRLGRIARRRGLTLLVGLDVALARGAQADGVHLPERAVVRRRPPGLRLMTGAAHSALALRRAARFGVDAAVLSPVFPSRSPSAAKPLGLRKARALAARSALPVYALGGIRIGRTPIGPFCGLAAIDGLVRDRPKI